MRNCLFILVAFGCLAATSVQADQAYSFGCTRNDGKTEQNNSVPKEYPRRLTLTIQGLNAVVYWDKQSPDFATLSPDYEKFDRPRFFGLQNFVDCGNKGWVEVDKEMLTGAPGLIEITGEGNEDCGVGDVFYDCH